MTKARLTESQRQQVAQRKAEGATYKELKLEFGISNDTVCRIVNPSYDARRRASEQSRDKSAERAKGARYRKANRESLRSKQNEYHQSKPDITARNLILRQYGKQVLPPRSTVEDLMIRNLYLKAMDLTKTTGVPHEVDHIYPLSKGGPHLPWNMRVVTLEANRKKKDKIIAT